MIKRTLHLLCCFAALLIFSGCAQNTVPLVYTPAGPDTIPSANATSICVVYLTDARSSAAIGQRSDNSLFSPSSDVSEWMSRSLASELTRAGFIVSLAGNEEEALQSKATYIITGNIEEIWLTEHSSTSYSARMRVGISLKAGKKTIVKNTFNSSLSKQVIPMASVPKNILSETLADLLRPMALFIRQKTS